MLVALLVESVVVAAVVDRSLPTFSREAWVSCVATVATDRSSASALVIVVVAVCWRAAPANAAFGASPSAAAIGVTTSRASLSEVD